MPHSSTCCAMKGENERTHGLRRNPGTSTSARLLRSISIFIESSRRGFQRRGERRTIAPGAPLDRRRSGDELADGGGRARIHVSAAVQVIVDLGGAAGHARVQETREGGCLQVAFADLAGAQGLPKHLEQQRGNDRIDVNAVHIARNASIEQLLY